MQILKKKSLLKKKSFYICVFNVRYACEFNLACCSRINYPTSKYFSTFYKHLCNKLKTTVKRFTHFIHINYLCNKYKKLTKSYSKHKVSYFILKQSIQSRSIKPVCSLKQQNWFRQQEELLFFFVRQYYFSSYT